MHAIKTIAHSYSFLIDTPEGRNGYNELLAKMAGADIKCFESHGMGSHYMPQLDGLTVELETAHVFDNQWNTAPIGESKSGYRLFDWVQDYIPYDNVNLKRGHWLEMSNEMRHVRIDTHACGYCGKQCTAEQATPFCTACIDGEYLKVGDLPLTRMQSVASKAKRKPLTESELAERMPIFTDAQINGSTERGRARLAKLRIDTESKRDKAIASANAEHDGKMWLIERGITESVIYYNHTGRFGFGWSRPVADELRPALLAALDGFPFAFDVK